MWESKCDIEIREAFDNNINKEVGNESTSFIL